MLVEALYLNVVNNEECTLG